jgi:hypothetical protein
MLHVLLHQTLKCSSEAEQNAPQLWSILLQSNLEHFPKCSIFLEYPLEQSIN